MKTSFEERLAARCGSENIKSAKAMLKSGALQGVWRDSNGRICGHFHQPGTPAFECCVTPGDESFSDCPCGSEMPLCAHGAALVMYSGSIAGRRRLISEPPPNYYGGLRKEELSSLVEKCKPPRAYLEIEAYNSSPHVPSKWETAAFSVALYGEGGRKYLGNLNNLRKLYFDKSLSVTLKYEHFSLQERQIIRFLAVNGELNGTHLVLDAEATAEFFHTLIDFPRFFRNGKVLKINAGHAVPVLLVRNKKMYSGFSVDGAVITADSVNVITGRAGCWIGRDNEYFFIPATCEITFLRNFFRSGAHTVPENLTREEYLRDFPFPVIPVKSVSPALAVPAILLDGVISGSTLTLSVEYIYRDKDRKCVVPMYSGTLLRNSSNFLLRNREMENQFETALELFGFILSRDGAVLTDGENSGKIAFFIDRVLPDYLRVYPQLALGASLAGICRGGQGAGEIHLSCRIKEVLSESYVLQYDLVCGNTVVDWSDVEKSALRFDDYFVSGGNVMRMTPEMSRFFRAAGSMIRNHDNAGRCFELPFYNISYFQTLTAGIGGACPAALVSPEPDAAIAAAGNEFTFKGTLRKYQQEGVAFLQFMSDRRYNVILADEMGLGKTVQVLAFLASRLRKNGEPALVVCPASLVVNWEREAASFVPDLRILAPQGSERTRVLKEHPECDLLILSYTAARLSCDALLNWKFSYAVLDEAQHIKNPGSGNAKNCKNIRSEHRLVLSGTPLENSPEDLWSVMDYLHPGMLGSLSSFRHRYAGIASDDELAKELAARITPFIKRRTKKEVAADLPQKSEKILYCDFAPEQKKLYDRILAEGRAEIQKCREGDVRANALIFNTLLRLRQVCCNPELLPGGVGKGVPSAKMELLMELLHENIDSSHKVLLFSQFTSFLQSLFPLLDEHGINYEYLDGTTTHRQKHVDNFNKNPDLMLFLLSIKAGGTGLNLTSADRVIIYDPWWNPAVELQAADRTHRIGQTKPVMSVKMVVRNSVEEKILALQGKKRKLFDALVETPGETSLTLDELRFLLEEK